MPYSYQLHTATAGQQNFSFAQIDGYVTTADLRVYVNGVLQSTTGVYTINTTTVQVQFITGRTVGDTVLIRRFTAALKADREVDFDDGSILTASDLDNSALQLLYLVQEGLDEAKEFCLRLNSILTAWDAQNKRITNVGTPTDPTDAATKQYVDSATIGSVAGAANLVQATPNGSSGFSSLRALVGDDVPRLNAIRTPTASVDLNSQKIINLLDPTLNQDGATKKYVDDRIYNWDPYIVTSTYSGSPASYSNTDSIVTNVGATGRSQLRLNGHLLPVRRLCIVDGIVGPFDGTSTGPHWFSLYNGSASQMKFRIFRAYFDWLANQSPWLGQSPQAAQPWSNPWEAPPTYSATTGPNPFLNSITDADGVYTINATTDYKFYRGGSAPFWTGTWGTGEINSVTGGLGPAVSGTIVNGARQGTYSRIVMMLMRLT